MFKKNIFLSLILLASVTTAFGADSYLGAARARLSTVFGGAKDRASTAFYGAQNGMNRAWNGTKTFVVDKWRRASWENVKTGIKGVPGNIKNSATSAYTYAAEHKKEFAIGVAVTSAVTAGLGYLYYHFNKPPQAA